jgi:hypothetical protein
MARQLTDARDQVAKFRAENRKLFEDNRRLSLIVKETRGQLTLFEQFHNQMIQSLENQIASLQRENQSILAREMNLAAGHPEYEHLQRDYAHLQGSCAQLKQHIAELQSYINLPNQMIMQASQLQNRPVGQPTQGHGVPQYAQDSLRKEQHQQQQQLLAHGPLQNVPGPQAQTQRPGFHPNRPSIVIPNVPGSSTQVQQGNHPGNPNSTPPFESIAHANQVLAQYKPWGEFVSSGE